MSVLERATRIIHGIDDRIDHSKASNVIQVVAPGTASLGEIGVRSTVDGIPIGLALVTIRSLAVGNYDYMQAMSFLLPLSLIVSGVAHMYLHEITKDKRKNNKPPTFGGMS